MRVVLDTNIFVSATIKPNTAPALVTEKFLHGEIEALVSRELLKELEESIFYLRSRKYSNWTDVEVMRFVGDIKEIAQEIVPDSIERVIVDDPDDDVVLAIAIAGRADYIVSGDRHLLDLREYKGVPIITATRFLNLLENLPSRQDGLQLRLQRGRPYHHTKP